MILFSFQETFCLFRGFYAIPILAVWLSLIVSWTVLFRFDSNELYWITVPKGSPSRGGDVVVYVKDINQPSLPTLFSFYSCVYFCLYDPFSCILFHKFSRQLSAFSLCSSEFFFPLYWSFELYISS